MRRNTATNNPQNRGNTPVHHEEHVGEVGASKRGPHEAPAGAQKRESTTARRGEESKSNRREQPQGQRPGQQHLAEGKTQNMANHAKNVPTPGGGLAGLMTSLLAPGMQGKKSQQSQQPPTPQQKSPQQQGPHAETGEGPEPHTQPQQQPQRKLKSRRPEEGKSAKTPKKPAPSDKGKLATKLEKKAAAQSTLKNSAMRGQEPTLRASDRNFMLVQLWLEGALPELMLNRMVRYAAGTIDAVYKKAKKDNQPTEEQIISHLLAMLAAGGEFTHQHSVRVMELALELCDELGIDDPNIRYQVRMGALFKDIGEHDYLLSRTSEGYRNKLSGWLSTDDMWTAGVLHDIGKLRVPEEILHKPGKLTEEEFNIIKMHPVYGEQILYRFPPLRKLCPAVRGHHERWDGKGYPDNLEGDEIPVAARVIALADVFDALFADRPYRRGMPFEKVIKIIEEGAGTHFDPLMVPAFLRAAKNLKKRGLLETSQTEASTAPAEAARDS